ncbi:PhoU domain-containing protein, partial [Planctomycetota bacterium]
MKQIFATAAILFATCAQVVAQNDDPGDRAAPITLESSPGRIHRGRIDQTFNQSLTTLLSRHPTCTDTVKQFVGQLQLQNDPSREYVIVAPLPIPDAKSESDRRCLSNVARLRRQYAEQLVRLAKSSAKADPNLAFRLLNEASLHDPENKLANAITRNRIHSTIDVKAKLGRAANPEFGWAKKEYFIVLLARAVIKEDQLIDRAEVAVQESCVAILENERPVGLELRFVVATLKINDSLE